MSYSLLRQAVLDRVSLTAMYQGRIRKFSPHSLGLDSGGDEHVMTYQYGGDSSKGLPLGGEWRCFRVAGLSSITRNGDSWHTSTNHSRPNNCVTRIDVQVTY